MIKNRPTTRVGLFHFLLAASAASGVGIDLTIDPPGPTVLGGIITVNLAVSGWQAGDGEVDAISFTVEFDPVLFEYVPGSGVVRNDGNEFLALPKNDIRGTKYYWSPVESHGIGPLLRGKAHHVLRRKSTLGE